MWGEWNAGEVKGNQNTRGWLSRVMEVRDFRVGQGRVGQVEVRVWGRIDQGKDKGGGSGGVLLWTHGTGTFNREPCIKHTLR